MVALKVCLVHHQALEVLAAAQEDLQAGTLDARAIIDAENLKRKIYIIASNIILIIFTCNWMQLELKASMWVSSKKEIPYRLIILENGMYIC